MEEMDRCERLRILWKLWQRNYTDNKGGCEQVDQKSIRGKSLELIVGELFNEIQFLKEEICFLREEANQKTELITTLTDSTLQNISNETNSPLTLDDYGIHPNHAERITTNTTISIKDQTALPNHDYTNESETAEPSHTPQSDHLNNNDDRFYKEEVTYLREELQQKSKIIGTLVEALTSNNFQRELYWEKIENRYRKWK